MQLLRMTNFTAQSPAKACSTFALAKRVRKRNIRYSPFLFCFENKQHKPGRCEATTRTYQPANKALIKICGVISVEDAEVAAKAGANFIGMILWPKARRAVSVQTATRIAAVAKQLGAKPVAVFVNEEFADIVKVCKQTGITIAQLHGKSSRAALPDLPNWLEVIYVLHAAPDGTLQFQGSGFDVGTSSRHIDWWLVDGLKGGGGQTYDWRRLEPPMIQEGTKGWLLAGGLSPDNVKEAVLLTNPTGVDVSSGVAGPDGLNKDPDKIFAFIEQVRRAAQDLLRQPRP